MRKPGASGVVPTPPVKAVLRIDVKGVEESRACLSLPSTIERVRDFGPAISRVLHMLMGKLKACPTSYTGNTCTGTWLYWSF